ncbi:hypothetical protein BJ912DRAFT_334433 [Pholiota molesta]|nr:hypothetical protein BJ912DRAFT_334433 [Pholiota molesta]
MEMILHAYEWNFRHPISILFLERKYPDPKSPSATSLLNAILDAALLLPILFPSHTIPYLDTEHPTLLLSQLEIKCLLAHQILNTLSVPKGNTWGCTFVCWYSAPQALDVAVSGYLSTVLDYFSLSSDSGIQISYQYYTNTADSLENELAKWMDTKSGSIFDHIILEPTSTETVAFPHHAIPCTLIASNESPGFGASCTQEELVTGACPPLLLLGALFISPPISADASLLAYGRTLITHWRGQGREACLLETSTISNHTFLFLDASELDVSSPSHTLADLDLKHLIRDLHKAYTGFLALVNLGVKEVSSPLWGAGAFGGDPIVKTLILAIAAARAGVLVYLSIDQHRSYQPSREPGKSMKVLSILQHLKMITKCRNGFEVAEFLEHITVFRG